MSADLESAFGIEAAEALRKARTRMKRLRVEGDVKNEIISQFKEHMSVKPEEPQMMYMTHMYGRDLKYDVMLAETQDIVEIREGKYNPSVSLKWRGEFLTSYMVPELAESLQPKTHYLLVGKYKLREGTGKWQGRTFNNFNVHGLIIMDDITNFKEDQEQKEIDAKVEEHKEE